MALPTQYQFIQPSVQNTMGGAHLHTPPSIFQHMMSQQNNPPQPGNWNQLPEVPPMYMPWSVPSLQQPQLVRFTGERPQQACGPMVHQKRKLDVPEAVNVRPSKQFISEEKMAAHFREMHISSNYAPSPVASTSSCFTEPQASTSATLEVCDVDIEANTTPISLESGKSMHPRLVISEELKRLQTEPILPASLLSKLERPSMALVLWEPPSKHLRILSTRQPRPPQQQQQQQEQPSTSSTIEEDDNNNNIDNNNEQIPDLNQPRYSNELEPMDL